MTNLSSFVYVKAIDAEKQISEFNGWHCCEYDTLYWIPNCFLLSRKQYKLLKKIQFLQKIVCFIFVFLILPIYWIKDLVVFGQIKLSSKNIKNAINCKKIFVSVSVLWQIPVLEEQGFELPDLILEVPWGKKDGSYIGNLNSIDLLDILSFREIITIYLKSYLSSCQIAVNSETSILSMYCYTAFRWHLLKHALESMEFEEVWISNHYDRWTVLVDSLSDCSKVMIQHGDLANKSVADAKDIFLEMRNKLQSSWVLVYFLDEANLQFQKTIFANKLVGEFRFKQSIRTLSLTNGRPAIGIVGIPVFWPQQKKDIQTLISKYGSTYQLVYRPHPRHDDKKINKFLGSVNITMERNGFPICVAIMSYPSTLNRDLENSSHGPIFIFDYRNIENADKTREELLSFLDKLYERPN